MGKAEVKGVLRDIQCWCGGRLVLELSKGPGCRECGEKRLLLCEKCEHVIATCDCEGQKLRSVFRLKK